MSTESFVLGLLAAIVVAVLDSNQSVLRDRNSIGTVVVHFVMATDSMCMES